MKNLIHKYKFPKMIVLTAVMLSFLLVHYLAVVSASSGTLGLTSNASSVTIGSTFVVTVTANTDEGVTVAETKVAYNKAAVSVVGVDITGSPFNAQTSSANPSGDGFVFFSSYTAQAAPSGSNLVGKITFKALRDTGDAGLSISKADSGLYNLNGNILTSVSGVVVTLKPVPVVPPTTNPTSPPATGGTSGSGSSGGSGSAGSTSNDNSTDSSPGGALPSDTTTLGSGAVGTQPPEGSINEPLAGDTEVISKKSGVDGLSIEQYRKQATIGVTTAIILGGAGYLFFFLKKKNTFLHHKPSVAGAKAVVFDGTKHTAPTPTQPTTPSNIITPQHKDD